MSYKKGQPDMTENILQQYSMLNWDENFTQTATNGQELTIPLPWAVRSFTRSGCSNHHPTWPWTPSMQDGAPKPAVSSLKHSTSKLTGEGSCTFGQYTHTNITQYVLEVRIKRIRIVSWKKTVVLSLPKMSRHWEAKTLFYVVIHFWGFFL